jgi:hypothetical protein
MASADVGLRGAVSGPSPPRYTGLSRPNSDRRIYLRWMQEVPRRLPPSGPGCPSRKPGGRHPGLRGSRRPAYLVALEPAGAVDRDGAPLRERAVSHLVWL